MPCAALRSELLQARDRRQEMLDGLFPAHFPATVMLSLNLPGDEKCGARADRLFAWGERTLLGALPLILLGRAEDRLGPWAWYHSHLPALVVKRVAMGLEAGHPAGRLLDLDIFEPSGRPVDRLSLGYPPRTCLLCTDAALSCIRTQRHSSEALKLKAHAVIDVI